jgi:DsbC/DsbD-like thiol-disulfide interchange protein
VISAGLRAAYVPLIMLRTFLASVSLLAAAPALAGGFPDGEVAEIDVLPGWRTADGNHMAALRIRLAPGWKTYWRSPGDGGIPPQFNWSGSANLRSVRFHWPSPEVYEINGMRSIGYYDELILPMEIHPSDPAAPIRLRADVDIGVCEDICVPMSARIGAELVAPGAPDSAISAALSEGPHSAREAGVGKVACQVDPIADGVRLTARIDMPRIGPDEVVIFEVPDRRIWISESSNRRDRGTLVAASDLVPPAGAPFLLNRSEAPAARARSAAPRNMPKPRP